MVYLRWLRSAIIPVECIGNLARRRLLSTVSGRVLCADLNSAYAWNSKVRNFRTNTKMMVDAGAPENRSSISIFPEKADNGGSATGGCKSEDGKLSCGYSSCRGKRASMEDFYDVKMFNIEAKTVCMFGIFDGHGGSRAAEYLKGHLFENLLKHPQFMAETKLAISETYKRTDNDFLESEKDSYRDDGSTASTAVLVGNRLYVANVGDSRTITSKSGRAIPLSEDHKPNRTDERKRIESAGGVVMWAGTWRVGGVLAMSRAFGNRMLKQFVVAEPEIQEVEINQEFELLVLASDGLWDVVPNEDAVSIARTEEEPEVAARKLTEIAFTRGSADNITCIVVKFHHQKEDPATANHHDNLHVSEVKNSVGDQPIENKTQQAGNSHCGKKEEPAVQKINQAAQSHLDNGPDGQKVNQAVQRDQGKNSQGGQDVNHACQSHQEKMDSCDQQLSQAGQRPQDEVRPADHRVDQDGQSRPS